MRSSIALARSAAGCGLTGRRSEMRALGTEIEQWVTVERASKAWCGTGSPPVLHRAGCRYVKVTKPENVHAEEAMSAAGLWTGAEGHITFDHACKTCCPDLQF
jgi:hypothetical protein